MNHLSQSMTLALGAAAAALLFSGAAAAAQPSEAQQRYQQERAVCLSGASNQDRATCLKEAGAALAEARRGGLSSAAEQNRVMRCNALPAPDRDDCVMRMEHGKMSGSAAQGGILRELEQPVPSR